MPLNTPLCACIGMLWGDLIFYQHQYNKCLHQVHKLTLPHITLQWSIN